MKNTGPGSSKRIFLGAKGNIYLIDDYNYSLKKLYHSSDGGTRWIEVTGTALLQTYLADSTAMAFSPTDPLRAYARARSSYNVPGLIYATTDGGANWVEVTREGLSDDILQELRHFAVDFHDPNTLYASSRQPGGSTNFGVPPASGWKLIIPPDQDGDGIPDEPDNCLTTPNPDQSDSDNDMYGDACDTCPHDPANDADADGIREDVDNCPVNANITQDNTDADGLGDVCDACPDDPFNDADKDGVCGYVDICPDTLPGEPVDLEGCSFSQLDTDGDGYTVSQGDYDDTDPAVNPGATEVCDGVDNDCNSQIDEGVLNIYYQDADSDGYGNLNQITQACAQPSGYVSDSTDCNDNVAGVNPGASDVICDGVDNNCNGTPDDGYVPSSTSCGVGVCSATGQLVCVNGLTQDTCTAGQPQTEGPVGDPSCNDNMDNDCDGNIDLSDPACINTPSGQDVTAEPVDETTGTTPVSVNFNDVSTDGATTLSTSEVGAPPPTGFKLGVPPTYYEISTTANYTGQIEVCINYSGISYANESTLKLFHHEDNIWVDITSYLDTENNIICGVTSSLSPFAIFEVINQPPVAEAGADLSLACLEMSCHSEWIRIY